MFSYDSIEDLSYDFQSAPNNKGTGRCKGVGCVPEPTQKALEAYSAATRELFQVKTDEDAKKVAVDRKRQSEEQADTFLALTAELCQNQPSKEDLEELPPRVLRGFLKWLMRSVVDPKVSTDDTDA